MDHPSTPNGIFASIHERRFRLTFLRKDFLGQFAVALAQKWVENEPVVISSEEAESLKAYFAAHAKELLDKGVTINKVNGKDTLFTISPADGSYKVNFGKEEFETYFKEFLRPQMIEMLF